MKQRWTFLLSAFPILLMAEPEKDLDLTFSPDVPGQIQNLANKKSPAFSIIKESPYGRISGKDSFRNPELIYPQNALGRKGKWDALRLGSSGEKLNLPVLLKNANRSWAISFWFYVYDQKDLDIDGLLVHANFGFSEGFRLSYSRKFWAKNGFFNLSFPNSAINKNPCPAGQWHFAVLNNDYASNKVELFLDGQSIGNKSGKIHFKNGGGRLAFGGRAGGIRKTVDFKLDHFAVWKTPLSTAEIKSLYEGGAPLPEASLSKENSLNRIRMEIPVNSYGYFSVGEKIPVSVSAPEADVVSVNGKDYALSDKITVCFEKPGVYGIDIAVKKSGEILRKVSYPVAVIPEPVKGISPVGGLNLNRSQPEDINVGIRFDYLTVSWAELEPQKETYNWSGLDQRMEWNRKHGVETAICLTGIPDWAKSASNVIPANLEAYEKILALLAARYDNVKFWGIMEKAPMKQLKEYAELLKIAGRVIRKEIADAKILAAPFSEHPGNLKTFQDAVPGSLYDIVTVAGSGRERYVAHIRLTCRNAGKPVWNISAGFGQSGRVGNLPLEDDGDLIANFPGKVQDRSVPGWPKVIYAERYGAERTIRELALQFGAGVHRIILQNGVGEYEPEGHYTSGQPGWKGIAMAVFANAAPKGTVFTQINTPANVIAVKCVRPDKTEIIIAFAQKGTASWLPSGAESVRDAFGNPVAKGSLTEMPVYISLK